MSEEKKKDPVRFVLTTKEKLFGTGGSKSSTDDLDDIEEDEVLSLEVGGNITVN